jgi:DDE superfamily endonuclease
MGELRYAEVRGKERKFLDLTSLTVEVFDQLVPSFEEAFQERMKEWCLDGKKRVGRAYTSYANSPLPTPQDRLLFILVYLKTNPLQVVQGQLFGLPQNKANQWIHTLLPVLQQALRKLRDTPARSMEELAQRLNLHTEAGSPVEPEELSTMVTLSAEPERPSTLVTSSEDAEGQSPKASPLFASEPHRAADPTSQRCG